MSDEIRVEDHHHHHECICQSKGFRKFLVVAGGTFVGAFLALSLFAALHKPPVIIPMGGCPCGCHGIGMARPFMPPRHCDRGYKGDFHKKMMKHRVDNDREVKVEIDD